MLWKLLEFFSAVVLKEYAIFIVLVRKHMLSDPEESLSNFQSYLHKGINAPQTLRDHG